jgi:hypothetical protein
MAINTPCLTFRVVDITAIVAGEVGAILVSVLDAIFFSGCKTASSQDVDSNHNCICR